MNKHDSNLCHRRSQSGVSLVEVLVSVLILGIGLLGIAAMQAAALRNNESALGRSQAVIQSYAILDAMRANVGAARTGSYNRATTCEVPDGGTRVDDDWSRWMTGLKATMGNFDTTCGSVECDTTQCTVTVHWDDSRASHNSADIDAARNLTFTTVTRL